MRLLAAAAARRDDLNSGRQRDVQGGLLLHGQRNVGLGMFPEPAGLHRQRVAAGRQRGNDKSSRVVCSSRVRNPALRLGEGHLGPRHGAATRIGYGPARGGRIGRLRPRQCRNHEE